MKKKFFYIETNRRLRLFWIEGLGLVVAWSLGIGWGKCVQGRLVCTNLSTRGDKGWRLRDFRDLSKSKLVRCFLRKGKEDETWA